VAPLRILYVGLRNDYGDPRRGYSFEYVNFFETLSAMEDVKVLEFPFDEVMRQWGRETMNVKLLEAAEEMKPDICFFMLFTDEVKRETIRKLSDRKGSQTLNWFADDHWRFHGFSRFWAPLFHWVVTTDKYSVERYRRIGCRNVIKSQWGFNHRIYRRSDVPQDHDVTFVGQAHSSRRRFAGALERAGVHVEFWGKGWNNGRLKQNEMIELFSRTRINLNFADSSFGFRLKPIVKTVLSRRADGTYTVQAPRQILGNVSTLFDGKHPQIKGRNFEIPGSGGFLLTQQVDGIEEYFIPGREIALFHSENDLTEKVQFFLKNEGERESIRQAGYERALKDHTFQKRFEDIFRIVAG
jgi:spore maturation protein CgeB